MGASGAGIFMNDDACDWAYELEASEDLSVVQATIAAVLSIGDEYLDGDDGANALAAAEVIACLCGHWGDRKSFPEEVVEWINAHAQDVPDKLRKDAAKAIDRVLGPDSELAELWSEAEEPGEWVEVVKDLRARVLK